VRSASSLIRTREVIERNHLRSWVCTVLPRVRAPSHLLMVRSEVLRLASRTMRPAATQPQTGRSHVSPSFETPAGGGLLRTRETSQTTRPLHHHRVARAHALTPFSVVITGLDPVIHLTRPALSARRRVMRHSALPRMLALSPILMVRSEVLHLASRTMRPAATQPQTRSAHVSPSFETPASGGLLRTRETSRTTRPLHHHRLARAHALIPFSVVITGLDPVIHRTRPALSARRRVMRHSALPRVLVPSHLLMVRSEVLHFASRTMRPTTTQPQTRSSHVSPSFETPAEGGLLRTRETSRTTRPLHHHGVARAHALTPFSVVITGLDPVIHLTRPALSARRRVMHNKQTP
jgi:hypothetical protein